MSTKLDVTQIYFSLISGFIRNNGDYYIPMSLMQLIVCYYRKVSLMFHWNSLVYGNKFHSFQYYSNKHEKTPGYQRSASSRVDLSGTIQPQRGNPQTLIVNQTRIPSAILRDNLLPLPEIFSKPRTFSIFIEKKSCSETVVFTLIDPCTLTIAQVESPECAALKTFEPEGVYNKDTGRYHFIYYSSVILWSEIFRRLYVINTVDEHEHGHYLELDSTHLEWKEIPRWKEINGDVKVVNVRRKDASACLIDSDKCVITMGGRNAVFGFHLKSVELHAFNGSMTISLPDMNCARAQASCLYHDMFNKVVVGGFDIKSGVEYYDINKDKWVMINTMDDLQKKYSSVENIWISSMNPNYLMLCLEKPLNYNVSVQLMDLRSNQIETVREWTPDQAYHHTFPLY